MPFCPNPECPHKKKTGKPAEFLEGFTHCSDCGSLLVEKITGTEETIEKQKTPLAIPTDLKKRLLYTLGFVLLWRVLAYIPVSGIDFDVLERFILERSGNLFGTPFRISVFALGIMPYLTAYVFVEFLALFVPPLKSWRQGGYSGRAKLFRTALWVTLALAFLQGYSLATGIESMAEGAFVINPGMGFRLLTTLTITTGTFITVLIADLITKRGIGHGISIILISSFVSTFFGDFLQLLENSLELYSYFPFLYFLLLILIPIILIVFIVFIEKTHRRIQVRFDDKTEAFLPLKLTTAGTVPIGWTASFVMLPATIAGFSSNTTIQQIANFLTPGEIGYHLIYFIILIFFYYLFTSLFHNPRRIVDFLKERNASIVLPSGENEEKYIDRSLEVMAIVGALYLCILVFIPDIFVQLGGYFFGGIVLIKTVAIILDLVGEVRMRRESGSLVKVAELHDVPKAGLVKSLLEQKGIPCHLRGYYHRALLYFFGPFIEISALVHKDRANEADEVIKRYLDLK